MLRGDDKYERPIRVLFAVGEGHWVAGQLKLRGGDLFDSNVASIDDDEFVFVAGGDSLHGVSVAGIVSVLDCVRGGMLCTTCWGDFAILHGDVSFRYGMCGKQHVAIDDKCVRGIRFTLEGAESSVLVFETVLGTVHVGRAMQVDFFGRSIEDTPRITVDFDDHPTIL